MEKELELYLHIPFCIKKCAYCDFLSASADETAREEYVFTIIKEIQSYKEEYHGEYLVTTIFIGGGTPSILEGPHIKEIFVALHSSFQIAEHAEITIEANPGTVTPEKLNAWKAAGINRLSIGLQSSDYKELKLLGRIHSFGDFLDTYDLARKNGFKNINIDLISAIPGQTLKSWEDTLTKAAELGPEHISAYSLIIEEGTPFYKQYGNVSGDINIPARPSLPDEETERAIYEKTAVLLSEYGYRRYEISNYAKKGFECRHNQGYWERKEYLGIGLGASSLIGHKRYHNTTDCQAYRDKININASIKEDIQHLSLAEEIEEYMFLGLREMKGVSIAKFQETFHKDVLELYGRQIKKLAEGRLIEIRKGHIRLTPRGTDLCNTVSIEFLDP